jgi:hypothetical protein
MQAKVRDLMTPGAIGVDHHQSIGGVHQRPGAERDQGSALSDVSAAPPNI